ncbi:hypothetical protein Tco_1143301 [Tanacetum coccineum]
MNTTYRESSSKTDERIDKLADQISTLVEIVSKKVVTPAPVKAVEEIFVTCNGPHAWYNCPNTDNNQSSVCAATNFSPTITIDPNPERFINEPALVCLPLPRDDDDVKGCDFPFCDNKMIFSNPLFGFNDDLTSSDDKSFLEEDVPKETFKIYSNPLFEFDKMLEDVESEDSNVSNFDEPVLLNTPLFDEDECFDPGGDIDEIDVFLAIDVPSDIMDAYNDSKGDVLEILHNTTHNLFPGVFLDHDPRSLKDEPDNDDLMTEDKVFDPGVMEKFFSPSYVRLSSKDRHYLFFTIVFSFGSEDTIFDPGIYAFHFSSLEPVAFKCSMKVCSPMDN